MASNPLPPEEKEGYRLGESARLSHILSGFDVVRPRLDDAIERAFHQSNVVLVRGASGQGKSTACYRYLYGKGLFWAFEVSGSIDEKDALDIAACLRGLSKEKEGPVHAYIDGAVGRGWPLLAREIRKSVPNVCLLVSIREEDLNASLSGEWENRLRIGPRWADRARREGTLRVFCAGRAVPLFRRVVEVVRRERPPHGVRFFPYAGLFAQVDAEGAGAIRCFRGI